MAAGFGEVDTIVVHDADISTYESSFIARLARPIVDDRLGFDFVKGFYPRFDSEGLNGRATRLLVGPLLESLISSEPDNEDLRYLASFRYPLAGEFASRISVAQSIPMPEHWGVDISLLVAVKALGAAIAQTDLTDRYDHKHQLLSADNAQLGLHRMAGDVIGTLLSIAGTDVIDANMFDEKLQHAASAHRANAISNGIPANEGQELVAGKLIFTINSRKPGCSASRPSFLGSTVLRFSDCIQDLAGIVDSQNTSPGAISSSHKFLLPITSQYLDR